MIYNANKGMRNEIINSMSETGTEALFTSHVPELYLINSEM